MHTVQEMTDEQFSQWSELLTSRTGMVLTEERRSFLTTSIGLRMNEIGCKAYDDYLDRLLHGDDRMSEWSILVDRITIHETRFFRHPAAIDLVRQYVRERPGDPDGKPLSIQAWSVGCSTGEEAYSLAIAIDQALGLRQGDAYFGVTATDISQPSLAHGREGIYSLFRLGKTVDDRMLSDYFEIVDEQHLQVKESLRKRICFARLNIQDISHSVLGKMDVIYCHNLESSQVEKVRSDNTLAYRRIGTQ